MKSHLLCLLGTCTVDTFPFQLHMTSQLMWRCSQLSTTQERLQRWGHSSFHKGGKQDSVHQLTVQMANCIPLEAQKQRLKCLILVMLHLPIQKLSPLETSERPLESHTFSNVEVPGHKHNHYIIISQYSVFGIHSFFSQLQNAWASLFLWLCSPEHALFILGSV